MALANVIKAIFGSKADRDYKAVKPTLDKVLAAYAKIDALSIDELREKSAALRARLAQVESPFENRISEIKRLLEGADLPIEEKVKLAGESEKLVKDEDDAIEKALTEILPEAFAVMKSTARRFAQNPEIRVKATEFDRTLSIDHDFVHIEGDEAVWQNHWMAGGNEVTWDMVHYDVQLIGGIALHQGFL